MKLMAAHLSQASMRNSNPQAKITSCLRDIAIKLRRKRYSLCCMIEDRKVQGRIGHHLT